MSRFGSSLVAVILAGGATGCLLYTDPINVAPEVVIASPDKVFRGVTATFTATAMDPDQGADTLTYAWGTTGGACPTAKAATMPEKTGTSRSFDVTRMLPNETFCVWVFVTDKLGARSFAGKTATVENRPPMATIDLAAPTMGASYQLFSKFRLSGNRSVGSVTGDSLTFRWTLTGPDGAATTPPPCPGTRIAGPEICFAADVPGTYKLELKVNDTFDDSPPATTILMVDPDRPPCIRTTSPTFTLAQLVKEPAEAGNFAVLHVDDDGDPLPPPDGQPADPFPFVWSLRLGTTGNFKRLSGVKVSSYTLPAGAFREGDVVQLRVEYRDRVERDLSGCRTRDAGKCELQPGSGCYQWVTWTVQYL